MKKKWKFLDGDLLLTTVCPVECEFCVYSCNLRGEWMSEKTIRRVSEQYTKNNIGIRVSGGEPFYNLKKLEKCLDIVLEYQNPNEILVITSGFFAKDKISTKKALKILTAKKLDTLVVSTDRFHLIKVPLKDIESIIVEAKKQGVKIILRITTDKKSNIFIEDLAKIIVKHDVLIEPHHSYGIFGKAELLDIKLLDDSKNREKFFNKKIKEEANKLSKKFKIKDYIIQSPKRVQRKFASRFHATTFPNGNIYADTQTTKGTFMGNINDESFKQIITRFSKTLPGYILWSEKSNCKQMKKFLPNNVDDQCDYCRDQPLFANVPNEAIGRKQVVIRSGDDFDGIVGKYIGFHKELLLTFILEEKDLTKIYGSKVKSLLRDLKNKNIRLRLSRPLPKCLFGVKYGALVKEFDIPKDCYYCKELFYVSDLKVRGCKILNKEFKSIEKVKNRKEIWTFFNGIRLSKKLNKTCKKCLYLRRKQCDGVCFLV